MFGVIKNCKNLVTNIKEELKTVPEKVREKKVREDEELQKLPFETREQLKLFKIYFTLFFFIFGISIFISLFYNKVLFVIGIEFLIAMIAFILYKLKKTKYPRVLLMPVFAFLSCFGIICLLWFLSPSISEDKISENTTSVQMENTK